jgi:hypothetical protein
MNSAIANYDGSNFDLSEYATKIRLLAKTAALRAIVENRLAVADRAKTQKHIPATLAVGSLVDLYRVPKHKDLSGWRGPAVVLDLDLAAGTCTVKHQSRVYLLPVRHVRAHIIPVASFCKALQQQTGPVHNSWNLHLYEHCQSNNHQITNNYFIVNHIAHWLHPDELAGVPCFFQQQTLTSERSDVIGVSLAKLFDYVDELIPGKPTLAGKVLTANGWKTINESSRILQTAKQIPSPPRKLRR